MLLSFSVGNHRSLRTVQTLSLIASTLKDSEVGLLQCPVSPSGKALPAAIIYGANASGKSNLVSAISQMRSAVLFSHSKGEPGENIPRKPFALDPNCAETPSNFDIDFMLDGIRYNYGFEVTDTAFDAEWLHAFPKGRRQTLFTRSKGNNFIFGRELKGRNKIIADLTRSNSLFVSAAAQNDHEELGKISAYFRSLRADTASSQRPELAEKNLAGQIIDQRVIEFLKKIGTGVVSYRKLETDLPEEIQAIQREIFSALRKISLTKKIEVSEEKGKVVSFELGHRGSGGDPVFIRIDEESSGTFRLLVLLGPVFKALDEGTVIVVDELDANLHTRACEAVLALFASATSNPRGAQLIATTHDTNLLRSPLLRRDQIWFTEKDDEGASHLYPLTDIRTRRGDNIENGYLQGRYGAIPFSGPILEPLIEN